MPVTRFNSVGASAGSGFAAGLLATAGIAMFLGGDVVTDSTIDSSPSLIYSTGSYMTYQQASLSGTGGKANYNVASVSLPSDYGSGGSLMRAEVNCGNSPVGASTDLGVVSAVTSSGSDVWDDLSIGTGAYIARDPTNGLKIPSGHFVKLSASSDVTSSVDCVLKVWTSELYQP